MTDYESGISLWADENVLKFQIVVMASQFICMLKAIELHNLDN